MNVPRTRSAGGEAEEIEYRVRELTEESLYSRFMSSIKESIFGGKSTYAEWTAKLKNEGLNVYNALPADIRSSIDQGYEALCRTLGVAENNPGGIYVKMINILGLLSASDRVVYDRYDLDLQSLLDSKTPNRVTYNVSGYSSALTGGDVENHATSYKVSYSESGDSFTVTNTAIQIVDLFKHWIPLGVEDEEMPDSAWLVLMSKPGVSDFENAKSMATEAGFDTSELANLELPVINPLEGGSGPFNVLSELVLDTDLSWVDTALGMPKIGVVKVDEADGWKKTIVDKKYDCGIPKEYRGAELSGEILRQAIKYLTDGAVDIPISYNFFSNYVTTGTKAYPELRWMSLDDFDMTEVIAKGKTVTQEDLDNFKPADLVFDKANLMTHIINVKFKAEPDEPEDIEYPDSNILNGCKIWDGDEANRPEWLKIHVKEGANEIEGSPVTLYKNDFVGKNLWTWTLTLDDSVDKHPLTVTEEYPSDYEYSNSYTPTVLGAMIANTWTPDAPPVPVTGRYRFTHIDRYGDERTKTVEVTLKEEEINGYSGNNYQPGVPTYIWTAEAQELFGKNPLLTAALAVTGNTDDDQKDVSVYKNDVEWDLIKLSADEATNMTPDSEEHTLTVRAVTKPYTFTFNYYFVKDGSTQYRGTLTDIEYGKPVTFDPNYSDPEKYAYIEDTIPSDEFCYWSADEAGLIPITTNLTFGMLLRGKWHDDGDSERAVSVYAQYNNNLTEDWVPLIEETAFTHMIDDDNDWVYLDYMTNYVSKDGKVVQDMVAEGDENIRYGLIAVKRPADSQAPDRDQMIGITQMMIGEDKASAYVGDDDSMVAYRFEYGKQEDTVKPISNFNRVLYTLRSDTEKAENRSFSVIAYITVDGQNYYYSEVNNDIDVHELLNQ